jgi:hypothetical protein
VCTAANVAAGDVCAFCGCLESATIEQIGEARRTRSLALRGVPFKPHSDALTAREAWLVAIAFFTFCIIKGVMPVVLADILRRLFDV